MNLFTLVISNLRRRKGRVALIASGLAIGVGTVVALHLIVAAIEQEVGAQLDQYGANIVVVPKSDTQEVSYGGVTVSAATFDLGHLTDEDIIKVKSIGYAGRLSTIAPKLLGSIQVDNQRLTLAGVVFQQELRMKQWWKISGRAPSGDGEVLAGFDAARRLGLTGGPNEPMVEGHGGHDGHSGNLPTLTPSEDLKLVRNTLEIGGRQFLVSGVLNETGGQDDGMIYCDLADSQRLLAKPGELSLIEISALCKGCPIDDIVGQIRGVLPEAKVSAVQQAVKARMQTAGQLSRFRASLSAVMVFIGYLVIFVTMMGSVVERTREIGVVRALGFRKRHVVEMFMIEAGIVGLIGGLNGLALGTVVGGLSLKHFVEAGSGIQVSLALGLTAVAGAVLVGIISSIYPAIKASRLDPTESLRYY
ncbi:MAG TPA: FtsX-like permease family protein [Blastocatellia bacterium]|nr:FtsX-like permease family protein [Blastocatellia bacterium]